MAVINVYFPNTPFQDEVDEIINKVEELILENREGG